MAGSPPQPQPFRAETYALGLSGALLSQLREDEAAPLGAALAAIEPWSRYGTSAVNLAALFAPSADGGIRLGVKLAGQDQPIGVVVIRHPWLAGPYLQFLAMVPGYQGHGFGRAVLHWFEAEAKSCGARNIWICAVSFNDGARRLYTSCGYREVAVLDDLIKPGFDEVFMRKRLTPSDN